jgi:hypothetical protein
VITAIFLAPPPPSSEETKDNQDVIVESDSARAGAINVLIFSSGYFKYALYACGSEDARVGVYKKND